MPDMPVDHDTGLPFLTELLTFLVTAIVVVPVSRMLRIHRERHVEEYTWAKLRGLIGLNVVHDRIHVHDDYVLFLTHHGGEGHELAILGFDSRSLHVIE